MEVSMKNYVTPPFRSSHAMLIVCSESASNAVIFHHKSLEAIYPFLSAPHNMTPKTLFGMRGQCGLYNIGNHAPPSRQIRP